MTAHYDPEIIDLTGNYWAGVAMAIVAALVVAAVVGSTYSTYAESVDAVPWYSQPKAIFLGLLAGSPVGLIMWASAPKRLVVDDKAITLERVITTRVIPLVRVSSVRIVVRNTRGGAIRFVMLFLRSGEKVAMPAPDGGVDDVYIAISSRLPGMPVGRSQASRTHPRSQR